MISEQPAFSYSTGLKSIFKKLLFREGLVWTVGLAVAAFVNFSGHYLNLIVRVTATESTSRTPHKVHYAVLLKMVNKLMCTVGLPVAAFVNVSGHYLKS